MIPNEGPCELCPIFGQIGSYGAVVIPSHMKTPDQDEVAPTRNQKRSSVAKENLQ